MKSPPIVDINSERLAKKCYSPHSTASVIDTNNWEHLCYVTTPNWIIQFRCCCGNRDRAHCLIESFYSCRLHTKKSYFDFRPLTSQAHGKSKSKKFVFSLAFRDSIASINVDSRHTSPRQNRQAIHVLWPLSVRNWLITSDPLQRSPSHVCVRATANDIRNTDNTVICARKSEQFH